MAREVSSSIKSAFVKIPSSRGSNYLLLPIVHRLVFFHFNIYRYTEGGYTHFIGICCRQTILEWTAVAFFIMRQIIGRGIVSKDHYTLGPVRLRWKLSYALYIILIYTDIRRNDRYALSVHRRREIFLPLGKILGLANTAGKKDKKSEDKKRAPRWLCRSG